MPFSSTPKGQPQTHAHAHHQDTRRPATRARSLWHAHAHARETKSKTLRAPGRGEEEKQKKKKIVGAPLPRPSRPISFFTPFSTFFLPPFSLVRCTFSVAAVLSLSFPVHRFYFHTPSVVHARTRIPLGDARRWRRPTPKGRVDLATGRQRAHGSRDAMHTRRLDHDGRC